MEEKLGNIGNRCWSITNMEDTDLKYLEIDFNGSNATKILRRFVENNAQNFVFEDLNKNDKRQRLFNIIFKYLQKSDARECHRECIECLRILSRDKTGLNDILDESKISTLLKLSCLYTAEEAPSKVMELSNTEIIVGALKALCNLVFNSTVAVTLVSKTYAMEGILARLRMYKEPGVPESIKLFDMKLLFFITALCPETRSKLKEELHGLVYLTETLDLILKESPPTAKDEQRVKLSDHDADLCCEILKVIFNLLTKRISIGDDGGDIMEDQEEALCLRLTSILHDLLLCEISESKRNDVRSHTVNLLTSVPLKCYSELTTLATDDVPKELEYNGRNMEVIEVLLEFLNDKLTPEKSKGKQDLLPPILAVLLNLSKNERLVRKYLRYRILPPLKDVWSRPEEGNSFRAKLCRLLTSNSTTVKNLTADFLFTLCKENAGRMIKYVGYGNAAGMFATRGLMLGPRPNSSSSSYSSDSDSDTEEYLKYADQINRVVGRYEPPRGDPMEGMTEEQKEYEAVKLANMMDKLSREGIIQPCRVDEDGRPQPVEHILQLQEDVICQPIQPK